MEFARDYLDRTFDWEPTGTYTVRLSAAASGPTAYAERLGMVVNANTTEWQRARAMGTAEKIVVHELFHSLQLQHDWVRTTWLLEGAAEYIAWQAALVEKGVYSAAVARGCQVWGVSYASTATGVKVSFGSLKEYEAGFPPDQPVYSLFYLAVDYLMQSYPITSLKNVPDFETAFGRSLASFYTEFEQHRSTWRVPSSYECQ